MIFTPSAQSTEIEKEKNAPKANLQVCNASKLFQWLNQIQGTYWLIQVNQVNSYYRGETHKSKYKMSSWNREIHIGKFISKKTIFMCL